MKKNYSSLVLFSALLAGIGIIPSSNGLNLVSILEKLEVPCGYCNDTIRSADQLLSNPTQLDKIVKTLSGICESHLLQEFTFVQKTCEKDVNAIVRGAAKAIHHFRKATYVCQEFLQCDSKFDFKIAKKKVVKVGFILLSLIGNYDTRFVNRLFTLIADRTRGSRMMVEKVCEDAAKSKNESLPIQKKLDSICNFKDGPECSLCEVSTEFLASYLEITKRPLEKVFNEVCTLVFAKDQCNDVAKKYADKLFDALHTAVHYHFICDKISFCSNNLVTKHCSKLPEKAQLACEIVELVKYSDRPSKLGELKKETEVTLEAAKDYCHDYLWNLARELEDNEGSVKKILESGCNKFSGDFNKACIYLLKVHSKKIFQGIVNFLESSKPCCSIGLCNYTSGNSTKTKSEPSTLVCDVCDAGVTVAHDYLNNPNTEENIKVKYDKLVKYLAEKLGIQEILPLADSAFHPAYIYLIKFLNSGKICTELTLC